MRRPDDEPLCQQEFAEEGEWGQFEDVIFNATPQTWRAHLRREDRAPRTPCPGAHSRGDIPLRPAVTITLWVVRRTMITILVIAGILVGLAVYGGSLPEGNVIREATAWLRYLGDRFADGFGGGYTAIEG